MMVGSCGCPGYGKVLLNVGGDGVKIRAWICRHIFSDHGFVFSTRARSRSIVSTDRLGAGKKLDSSTNAEVRYHGTCHGHERPYNQCQPETTAHCNLGST